MQKNPDVELDVNPDCFTEDVYNVPYVTSVLKGEQPGCDVDIVEIDMLMLGDVVGAGAVRPWHELPRANWHPASIKASTYQSGLYGIPHWMCSHFIFTRSPEVARANSSESLIDALDNLNTPAINLTGHFLLNWNTNALYLDSWVDNKKGNPASAISATELDTDVLNALNSVAQQCTSDGVNHCLDGSWEAFDTFDLPIELFANNNADSTFGYLERLNAIANYLPANTKLEDEGIYLNTIPFGKKNKPLIFTDSFVLSNRCVGSCADAANRFAAYISRTSTTEWIVASHDIPESIRIPRYLLVANRDTYTTKSLRNNPFFARADALTIHAESFPNSGFYPVLDQTYQLILNGISY
jgi:thiamine pyridinylase